MIPEKLLYGLILLMVGISCFILYTYEEPGRKDYYLIRPSFLFLGLLSVALSLYLMVKAFYQE